MTYRPVDLVKVTAWGHPVGYLAAASRRRTYAFSYDPGWVQRGQEISPILMPARNGAPYEFAKLSADTFHDLPPAIADSLPDRFGNATIDAYMSTQGVTADQITPLDRLAYLGSRTMGALRFEPEQRPGTPAPSALEMSDLVTEARQIIEGTMVQDAARLSSLAEIFAVGTSAGGARAKAVLAINDTTQEVRAGNVAVPAGFDQYLLKFDGVSSTDKGLAETQPYCRREYAYSLMAQAAGIEMSECRLLEEDGRAHFLTRRFDRAGQEPLHMQTLCALQALDYNLTGTHDYAQYFATINALHLGEDALVQAFRRMAFNILAANHDDHTKNFAFLMDSGGNWSLSPAYDLTFAYDPSNRWLKSHLMGVLGKFDDIAAQDMLRIADQFAIPYAKSTIAEIRDAIGSWGEFASAAGLERADTDMIGAHLLRTT